MHALRLVLITGNDTRHTYFIRRLNQHFPIHTVFVEGKNYPPPPMRTEEAREAWSWFFERRMDYERRTFEPARQLPRVNEPQAVHLSPGGLNTDTTLERLQHTGPDLVLLFDCGLVGRTILEHFSGRILNLHVGLTEAYRGSSCNFWPIHDERLDCLGATILRIDAGIDTGAIVAEGTIGIDPSDDEQTLMGKTVILGVDMMIDVIRRWQEDDLPAREPEKAGTLCLRKDFDAEAVLRVRKLVESPRWQELLSRFSRGWP